MRIPKWIMWIISKSHQISSMELSGSGSIEMTDEQTEIADTMTFKFFGDTVIDPPPQSFNESIEIYQSLPAASLEDQRVVSFSIAPLSDYCDESDAILNSISNANVESVSAMMVDFEQVHQVFRRLLNSDLALDFSRYRSVLLDLQKRFKEEESYFTSQMQTLLPEIRSGEAEDSALTTLLQEYSSSIYEKETFLALLAYRQKEIETAEFIIYNDGIHNKHVS